MKRTNRMDLTRTFFQIASRFSPLFISILIVLIISIIQYARGFGYELTVMDTCTRVAILTAILFIGRFFGSSSTIWRERLDLKRKNQFVQLGVLLVICSIFLIWLGTITNQGQWLDSGAHYEESIGHIQDGNQYNHLADAILKGQAYLDLPVADFLNEMDNPYDTEMRQELSRPEDNQVAYWDYAFYNEKYYCYFGVIPCLLIFLPFKALVGADLRTDYVVALLSVLSFFAVSSMLYQFARTYFKSVSFGKYLIAILFMLFSVGFLEQAILPRLYSIPILSSLFFIFAGFSFLVKAKRLRMETGFLPKSYLIAGSTCIALTLGCRPQHILSCVLILPLFWDEIHERLFFSRRGFANTASVIAPFILVAIPILYYNYIRFDSPFNFGASYNLTGADMTSYRFDIPVILARISEYLFLPPVISGSYPYIQSINETFQSQSIANLFWANEPFFGGFFMLSPASFFVLLIFKRDIRHRLRECSVLTFMLVALVLAVVHLVLVSYVSGITMRYMADFAWLIIISAVFIIWSCPDNKHGSRLSSMNGIIAFIVFLGLPLYLWTFLATSRFGAIITESPWLYYGIKQIMFL